MSIIINHSVFSGLYDLRKDKPYVMVTSPGSPEHLASNTARILRASKSVSGPNSLYVGGKIQVTVLFNTKLLKNLTNLITKFRSSTLGQIRI